jgi:hypothetical protein
MTEDGNVSKRGYIISQYAKYTPRTFWQYRTTASLNNAYTGQSTVVGGTTSADLERVLHQHHGHAHQRLDAAIRV